MDACRQGSIDTENLLSEEPAYDGKAASRQRDVFPLPYIYSGASGLVISVGNAAVQGLNKLYGCHVPSPGERLLVCQSVVHAHIILKCVWMVEALQTCPTIPSGPEALRILLKEDSLESRSAGVRLKADAFDILERSGLADATSRLEPEHQSIVQNPSRLFFWRACRPCLFSGSAGP